MVVSAGERDEEQSHVALQELCQRYWYPLYVFVRRKGYEHAEAEDLTQGFFAHLLSGDRLQLADQTKGRFRSFLLRSIENFANQKWREKNALKRGGNLAHFSLNFENAKARYLAEPSDELTPERAFDRKWALTLLQEVLDRLRDYYDKKNKLALFEALKGRLAGGDSGRYSEVAESLGMSEIAVKVASHRMKNRYRDLIRETIQQTVSSEEDVDQELAELFEALSG